VAGAPFVGRLKSAVVSLKPVPLTVAHCWALEFHSLFWKVYAPLSIEIVPNAEQVDWAAAEGAVPNKAQQTANGITNIGKWSRFLINDLLYGYS
jgi:hypothetical protein